MYTKGNALPVVFMPASDMYIAFDAHLSFMFGIFTMNNNLQAMCTPIIGFASTEKCTYKAHCLFTVHMSILVIFQ